MQEPLVRSRRLAKQKYSSRGLECNWAVRGRVRFERYYELAPEWNGDAVDEPSAKPIVLGAGDTAEVSAVLRQGATIEGRLSAGDGGLPRFTRIEAYRDGDRLPVASGSRASDGSFQIRGLASGTYRVQALLYPHDESELATTWYRAGATRSSSTPIEVAAPLRVTGIDFELTRAGTIAGRIEGGGYAALIDPVTFEVLKYGWTEDNESTFALRNVHPGTYLVRAWSNAGGAPQYYGGTGSSVGATPVVVASGETTSNIDIAPGPGTSITGTVRAAHSGAAVPSSVILVTDAVTGEHLGTASSDDDGTYSTGQLMPGSYKLLFEWDFCSYYGYPWCGGASVFEPQWSGPVTLGDGADTTGVDVELELRD